MKLLNLVKLNFFKHRNVLMHQINNNFTTLYITLIYDQTRNIKCIYPYFFLKYIIKGFFYFQFGIKLI